MKSVLLALTPMILPLEHNNDDRNIHKGHAVLIPMFPFMTKSILFSKYNNKGPIHIVVSFLHTGL